MKNYLKFLIMSLITGTLYFTGSVNAAGNDTSSDAAILNSGQSQNHSPNQKQDKLPNGVTQDWLNSLYDEDGNKIIPEEPETDAMLPMTFNGITPGSNFGASVSDAGDVNGDGYSDIIVGAPNYSTATGRAYIFFGGVNMNTTADVTVTGEAANNQFGSQVSTAGDVNGDGYSDVIVGASGYSTNTGRAYIYFGGTLMNNVADVILTGAAVNNYFGVSASAAGDVNGDSFSDVIVGAYGYSSNTGRAYIYFGGSSMNNVADVTMTGEAANTTFGCSVSTAGDVNGDSFSDVIVGAYFYSSIRGRAYIYFGGSSMNNVADVTMTGEASNNQFGLSVSEAGDVNGDSFSDVIVGANGYSSSTGRAYIYYGGSSMDNISDLNLTGETTSTFFGRYVSDAGDINGDGYYDVVIGAWGYSANTGRAYIYLGGSTMNNIPDVTVTGEGVNNYFGYPVSTAGDVNGDGYSEVIVGGYGYASNTGRAYLYDYYPEGEMTYDIKMTGEASGNRYGYTVSDAGDVNGDGYSDVIVGAWGYSTLTGRAYIYYGGQFMNSLADVTMTGAAANDEFGYSVSSAGDVNGDGYDDVIVGASHYSSNTGRAYIYFGGSSMNNVADVTVTGAATGNYFGVSVSNAGDVNGDSFSDVIVGAYGFSSFAGRAYIYFGGSTMNNVADVIMTGEASNNYFGSTVSTAEDVNNDGYSDVIVGANGYSSNTGRAYIYFGGSVMNNVEDVIITGETAGIQLGTSVSNAGDVNGDSFSDVIVGANTYSTDVGAAYIFYGGTSMNNVYDVIMTGETAQSYFGVSVSNAGDLNYDGYSDVIVGAYGYSSFTGRAYIFYGGASMNSVADISVTGEASSGSFGVSVSGAGDLDGNGYPDYIVGAYQLANNTGASYVYLSPTLSTTIKINLAMFIQGLYNPGSNSQVSDTIAAYLMDNNSPYDTLDQCKAVVSSNGVASLQFSNALTGTYYLAVSHRNSIQTWSAGEMLLRRTLTPSDYDFSTSSSQAFGSNQIQVDTSPNRFAVYNGDVNHDGIIDLTDIVNIFNDANIFLSGYVVTDVTGDGFVDLSDLTIAFNNSNAFVSVVRP